MGPEQSDPSSSVPNNQNMESSQLSRDELLNKMGPSGAMEYSPGVKRRCWFRSSLEKRLKTYEVEAKPNYVGSTCGWCQDWRIQGERKYARFPRTAIGSGLLLDLRLCPG